MTRTREPDREPRSDAVQADQVASYDGMRERCPIAYEPGATDPVPARYPTGGFASIPVRMK